MPIIKSIITLVNAVSDLLEAVLNRFRSRELLIYLSLLGAAISVLILLNDFVANFNDRLAIAGLLFTVVTAGFQWLENGKEKRNVIFIEYKEELNERIDNLSNQYARALNDLKKDFEQHIKAIKKQSDFVDDKHNNQIDAINVKLASLHTIVEQHLDSFGHNLTSQKIQEVQEKLFYLEAVLTVQTRYAEVLERLEELKR